jgi:endonuclease YncB( thermonuclease family)
MGKVLRFQRKRNWAVPAAVIAGAVVIGGGVGVMSSFGSTTAAPPTYSDTVTDCRVVDGDTLRCGAERVRLLAIDAPELPGHCAIGRDCAPGDPVESSQSLGAGMGDGGTLRIERVGRDRYGRTLALVSGAGGDLSCWQLRHGEAIYRADWDNGGRVARVCPDVAR